MSCFFAIIGVTPLLQPASKIAITGNTTTCNGHLGELRWLSGETIFLELTLDFVGTDEPRCCDSELRSNELQPTGVGGGEQQ